MFRGYRSMGDCTPRSAGHGSGVSSRIGAWEGSPRHPQIDPAELRSRTWSSAIACRFASTAGPSARRIYTVVPEPDLRTGSSPGPPLGVVPEPAAKPVPTPTTSVAVATWWHVMIHGRCTSWDGLSGSMHPCAAAAHPVCVSPLQRRSAAWCVVVETFYRLVGGVRERPARISSRVVGTDR